MRSAALLPRNARQTVLEALSESRVVCLIGARQVGKSTLVRDIAANEHPASIQTLDNLATRAAAQADPTGFVYSLRRPAVIDEVQRAPEVLLAIKELVDEQPAERGQFLLTGSANILTLPTVADALPGRVEYVELWPFSQGELRHRREGFLLSLFGGTPPIISGAPRGRQEYVHTVIGGGVPDVYDRSPRGRTRFFDSYVSSLLGRDLREVADVRDTEAVERLLRLIGARSATLVEYAGLSRDLQVSDKTVKSYLHTLGNLFLVRELQPWHANLGQRIVKSTKAYVCDTGLLAYLTRSDAEGLCADDQLAGRFFETFAVNELIRQASWATDPLHLYHYRDNRKREVDVVLERNDRSVCAVEVKAAASVGAGDFKWLRFLRDRAGERFRCGTVLYCGDRTLPFGDRLWAVPLQGLWS